MSESWTDRAVREILERLTSDERKRLEERFARSRMKSWREFVLKTDPSYATTCAANDFDDIDDFGDALVFDEDGYLVRQNRMGDLDATPLKRPEKKPRD